MLARYFRRSPRRASKTNMLGKVEVVCIPGDLKKNCSKESRDLSKLLDYSKATPMVVIENKLLNYKLFKISVYSLCLFRT